MTGIWKCYNTIFIFK